MDFKSPFSKPDVTPQVLKSYLDNQGVPVPDRPGSYVAPGESPYSANPSLLQRFTRSFNATPNFTEDALSHYVMKMSPEDYGNLRRNRASGGNQLPTPPANSKLHKAAEYLGGTVKEVIDPVGLVSSWYGKPIQVAAGAGSYEAAKDAMHQKAVGKNPQLESMAKNALYGGTGAYLGAKLFERKPSVLEKRNDPQNFGAILGRQLGASATGNVTHDAEARVISR
jgi:hypothetical protein